MTELGWNIDIFYDSRYDIRLSVPYRAFYARTSVQE